MPEKNSQTPKPQDRIPTAEEMNEQYQNGLTELMEKKKLGLLAQDQFDQQHQDLIERVFGKPKEK